MRVIAGTARGKRLEALPGEDVTRPTIERVKEAIFSSVQFSLPGATVLDLFAGSGQMGVEALSRGAKRCTFLDQSREAVAVITANCKAAAVFDRSRVATGEALSFLAATKEVFDLVLLDPPFHHGTLAQVLPLLEAHLAPGGVVMCESELDAVLPPVAGTLVLAKQYRYGKILVTRYEKEEQV
ncbi:MAG: 16S rRNA (guanine(966)-N(2))-methyltransferase RsmD [Gemmiger sp.]|nr:16S rRNA (guanine(966)-N(2))-methyltransferase RsmD [Gemmiger sp.]